MRARFGCFLVIVAFLASAHAAVAERDEAQWLLESSKAEDAARAAKIFEVRLASEPDSFAAHLGLARAITQQMAIRTNGNLPLVDGLQDTPEHRAIWSELSPRALKHARIALELGPRSAEAAATLATAYMFHASSLGIISSILSGAGSEYRTHAKRLIDMAPRYDDALGHSLLASFYLVAPWPVGDSDDALVHFDHALKIAPESVRNQYGLGIYWAREGEAQKARPHFERAVSQPCTANTEHLFCDWMKQAAERALTELEAS